MGQRLGRYQGEVHSQERPWHPRLDTGTPDIWEGVPDTCSSLEGENSGSPQNKLQMPWVWHSAQGPLHFNMVGFGQGANTHYGATGAGSGLA